jgi:hypothetical protein
MTFFVSVWHVQFIFFVWEVQGFHWFDDNCGHWIFHQKFIYEIC